MEHEIQAILDFNDTSHLGEVFRLDYPRECTVDMRVPDAALESVVYVGAMLDDDPTPDNFAIVGTGFLVHYLPPGETDWPRGFHLVTARHVVDDLKGLPLAVRINTLDNKAEIVVIPEDISICSHDDKSVDVAAIEWLPDPKKYRWKCIKSDRFLNEETPPVGIGDEIYSVGLFSEVEGRSRNVPIARIGNIAMMASDDELIPTKDSGPIKAYLIEGHSMAGFSGAPVVVRPTVTVEMNPNRKSDESPRYLSGIGSFFLLGIMHGQWEIPVSKRKNKKRPSRAEILHSAISAVVPASAIAEVITQSMERKQRALGTLTPTSVQRSSGGRRKARDIPIPEISRKQFFSELDKATQRRPKP